MSILTALFSTLFGTLSTVRDFLNILTWKKIAQLVVFLLVIMFAWAAYDTRDAIYTFVARAKISTKPPATLSISTTSQSYIDYEINKSTLIIAAQVIIVDFQKNIRTVIYANTSDRELLSVYNSFIDRSSHDFPLFNADVANNKNMVDLINGEFICNPYTETMGYKLLPESGKFISTSCAVGIPPAYGRFTGMIVMYTNRPPTPEEVDQIRVLMQTMSAKIYEGDFK